MWDTRAIVTCLTVCRRQSGYGTYIGDKVCNASKPGVCDLSD